MATSLRIGARTEGNDIAILSLTGEVEVANASQVRDAALKLVSGGRKYLVVDLSGVEYMDSTGLGTLVGLHKRLREAGGQVLIAGAQPRVRKIFDITGLTQVFRMHEDVSAALKEVRG